MAGGDCRYVVVGDDLGRVLYFDGDAGWRVAGEARGGAAKRMVVDPRSVDRALVACYDGRCRARPGRMRDFSSPLRARDAART
jgi:hypothetical protein